MRVAQIAIVLVLLFAFAQSAIQAKTPKQPSALAVCQVSLATINAQYAAAIALKEPKGLLCSRDQTCQSLKCDISVPLVFHGETFGRCL